MDTEVQAVLTSLLCKAYLSEDTETEVLKDVDFVVQKGEFAVISGPSGSGKTTLLNLISGIDKASSGTVIVFGEDLGSRDEDFLATFRCNNIGFVFQAYNLVSTLTVAENVAFPMEWLRKTTEHIENRVKELLITLGLERRAEHFPSQLSGGEQQRVAFARALANDPPLLLADEPTGNLDAEASAKIVQTLRELKEVGKTVVVVTHDEQILKVADKRWHLKNGKLVCKNERDIFPNK